MQLCLRCHQPCDSDKGFCQRCYASLLAYAQHGEDDYQPVPLLPPGEYPHAEIQPQAVGAEKNAYWSIENPQEDSPGPPLKLLGPTDKRPDNFMQKVKKNAVTSGMPARFFRTKNHLYFYIPLCLICIIALLAPLAFTQFHFPLLQTKDSAENQQQSVHNSPDNPNSPATTQSSQPNKQASSTTPPPSSPPISPGTSIAPTPGSTQATIHTPPLPPGSATANATPTVPSSAPVTNAPINPVSTQPAISGNVTILPTSFSTIIIQGQGNPAPTNITITNTENRSLSWQASNSNDWLTLTSNAGTIAAGQNANLPVGYNSAGLVPGSYHAQIQIIVRDAANTSIPVASQNIPVTLTITLPCTIQVTPDSLAFSAILLQQNIQPKNITLTESGNCNYPLTWRASADSTWLILAKTSGTDTGAGSTLSVSVQPQGAVLKTYNGTITLSAVDNNGTNVSINTKVTVKFTVIAA